MTKAEEQAMAWHRSVDRAVRDHFTGSPRRYDGGRSDPHADISPGMVRGLEEVLGKLPAMVTSRWPLELIAAANIAEVTRLQRGDYLTVKMLTMAQRGLGVAQALAFLKNLYWARKDVPNVHSMQLWSRQQIVEDLGKAFGEPIADAIANPSSQMVLNALIFKQYDSLIVRVPALVVLDFEIPMERALNRAHTRQINFRVPPYGVKEGYVAEPGDPILDLPLRDAEHYYERATGGLEPDFSFTLNPLEIDYADEAKEAEAALREINRPFVFPDSW